MAERRGGGEAGCGRRKENSPASCVDVEKTLCGFLFPGSRSVVWGHGYLLSGL